MSLPLAERPGRWTVNDIRRMPEDELFRYELDDGVLIVSPRPSSPHQVASYRITGFLQDAIEAADLDIWPVQAVETTASERDDWLKVPDVVVVDGDALDAEPQEFDVTDVLLAVEISGSRQSRNRDFGEKLDSYAEVGIKHYWIIELQPKVKVTAFRLQDGAYEEVCASHEPIRLTDPFPIEIDPTRLTGRRR